MHIFLSYASEDRDRAEQIYLALTGADHQVFFDRVTLPPGGDYNAQIRQALRESDLLIFLISPDSVTPSYALTELNLAREKWPHPEGRILPVMLRKTEYASIPNYLKAVTVFEPSGDAAADVAAQVARLEPSRDAAAEVETQQVASQKRGRVIWWTIAAVLGISFIILAAIVINNLTDEPPLPPPPAFFCCDGDDFSRRRCRLSAPAPVASPCSCPGGVQGYTCL
jgi:hypothetical protein